MTVNAIPHYDESKLHAKNMSVALKLGSLLIRTVAKPVGNYIKSQAREHERFRKICVNFAQVLHRADMRMRLGLLYDPAVIDRQIRREQEEIERKRSPKGGPPTVKTQEESEAEEREKEDIKKRLKSSRRKVKPLSESKAIETGATFISEGFLFLVAAALILGERVWSSSKEGKRRDEVATRLEMLEGEVGDLKAENVTLRDVVNHYRRVDGAVGTAANGKPNDAKRDDKRSEKSKDTPHAHTEGKKAKEVTPIAATSQPGKDSGGSAA